MAAIRLCRSFPDAVFDHGSRRLSGLTFSCGERLTDWLFAVKAHAYAR